MGKLPRIPSRQLLGVLGSATLAAHALSLGGCAAAPSLEARNGAQCRQFGLPPGSGAYGECLQSGPDAYAEAHPLTGGHWCSAPPSSPAGRCAGCAVNCGDKLAYCTRGRELWIDAPDACVRPAACECTQ
jgi:hypothetical protein